MSYVGGEYLLEISPSKGLEVSPGGFRLFAALAQTLAVESEDLLLQARQAGHSDAVVCYQFNLSPKQQLLKMF